MHQLIATLGIMAAANIGLSFSAYFVSPLGWTLSAKERAQILIETHYFPVEIVLALFAGWALGRSFPRKSMYWVWILPFASLLLALAAYRAFHRSVLDISSFSYVFGKGCEVRNGCFDQLGITLPFYTAVAYSVGSWFAQRLSGGDGLQKGVSTIKPWRTFVVSSLIWLSITVATLPEISGLESVPLSAKAAMILAVVVVFAAGTTLLALIGSALVGHFRRRSS